MTNEKLITDSLAARELLKKKIKLVDREIQVQTDNRTTQAKVVAAALDLNEKKQILEEIEGLISEVKEAGLERALNRIIPQVKKISDSDRKSSTTQSKKVRDTLEELLFQEDVRKAKDEARVKGLDLGPVTEGIRSRRHPDRFTPRVTGEVVKKDGDLIDVSTGAPIELGRPSISKPTLSLDVVHKMKLWNEAKDLGWSKPFHKTTKPKTYEKFIIKNRKPTLSDFGASFTRPDRTDDIFDTDHEGSGMRKRSVKRLKGGATPTRLQVLVGSIEAGNKSKALSKQVMEMSDELLIAGKLTKSQHKHIYDRYVKGS